MIFDFYSCIDKFFNQKYFSTVIVCHENPVIVTSLDVKKINSKVVRTSFTQEFNLKKIRCKIEDIQEILQTEVTNIILSSPITTSINWFCKKWLLFNFYDTKSVLDRLNNSHLILTSDFIYKKLRKIKSPIDIRPVSNLENEIFSLESDSIGVIINKNFQIIENDIEFEILIYNKNVKRLILE